MNHYESTKLRSGFYDPTRNSSKTNAIIVSVFCVLFGCAFFYSLSSTLNDMTRRDCAAGIQKACESLQ